MTARGFRVYCSAVTHEGGLLWPDMVQSGVRNSSALVAVCSAQYGASIWTKRELYLADHLCKPIVPLWHSGEWPPPAAAIYMQSLQFVPREGGVHPAGSLEAFGGASLDAVVDELTAALANLGIYPRLDGDADEASLSLDT